MQMYRCPVCRKEKTDGMPVLGVMVCKDCIDEILEIGHDDNDKGYKAKAE